MINYIIMLVVSVLVFLALVAGFIMAILKKGFLKNVSFANKAEIFLAIIMMFSLSLVLLLKVIYY